MQCTLKLSKRSRSPWLRLATAGAGLCGLIATGAGCLKTSSEASFIGGRESILCDQVWPVCKSQFAGCRLDEDHYIEGTFPGTRKFLVETSPGDWVIRVLLFLEDRLAPGTETEVHWFEPRCAEEYRYQLTKQKAGDLFELAGKSQVFSVEQAVVDAGDHFIEVYSDATCRYDLRVELVKLE